MSDTIATGIFCRGILLGYAKFTEQYRDKSGQVVQKEIHALGVEKKIKGRFGENRDVTQQVLLSNELMKDSMFLGTVSANIGQMVEIPLSGYTDFHDRPYVSNDAVLTVCGA